MKGSWGYLAKSECGYPCPGFLFFKDIETEKMRIFDCATQLYFKIIINTLYNMETFQEIINGDKPVLVDFFATWCGPCKAMSPVVESVGKEMQGQARVLKIDVDKNKAIASQFQVQAVPTFLIFKKGKLVWRKAGGTDKATLMQQIRNFI
jgi:thioredoxin 1